MASATVLIGVLFVLLDFSSASDRSSNDNPLRIYGGNKAYSGQFPFAVHLEIMRKQDDLNSMKGMYPDVLKCGGSLISNQWVLTAAHCLEDVSSIQVKLGGSTSEKEGDMTSEEYFIHENYDPESLTSDIGLVKLPKRIRLNRKVNAINLPTRSQAPLTTFEGRTGVIVGWGSTFSSSEESPNWDYPKYATVKLTNHDDCRNLLFLTENYDMANDHLCSYGQDTYTSACAGDDGGPLIVYDNNKRVLIGVTSSVDPTCEASSPTLYTNVAAYLDFIKSITGLEI